MRENIHPKWYPEARVTCSCGNTWTTGATVPEIRTDVCSNCHPFFTGEQRIVDTEGQVDRFYKRLERRTNIETESEQMREQARGAGLPIKELGLGARATGALARAGVNTVGQFLDRLEQGEGAVLEIEGFGRQSLIDIKKKLRARGISVPAGSETSAPALAAVASETSAEE
jgi:large subunit ribosomal protein L31